MNIPTLNVEGLLFLVVGALFIIFWPRYVVWRNREKSAQPEPKTVQEVWGQAIDSTLIELRRLVQLTEEVVVYQERLLKSQRDMLRTIFGVDHGAERGYQESDDAEAELQEKAEALERRYGIPHSQAVEQAKKMLPYERSGNSGGMSDRV